MPEDTIFEEDDYKFTFSATKDPGKIDLYYLKNGDASKPLKVEKDQSLTPDNGDSSDSGSSDSSSDGAPADTGASGDSGSAPAGGSAAAGGAAQAGGASSSAPVTSYKLDKTYKAPKLEAKDDNYELTIQAKYGPKKTTVIQVARAGVWPKEINVHTKDAAGKDYPNVELTLLQGGQDNFDFSTDDKGLCDVQLKEKDAYQIQAALPWEIISDETPDENRKHEVTVKYNFIPKFVSPVPAAPGVSRQYVNLDSDTDGSDGQGHTVTFTVGVKTDAKGRKGQKDDVIYIQAKFSLTSKRNDPKPAMTGADDIANADGGKTCTGSVKLKEDGGTATFSIELGIAGGDTCEVRLSSVKDTFDDGHVAPVRLQNWRKIWYELSYPALLAGKLDDAPVTDDPEPASTGTKVTIRDSSGAAPTPPPPPKSKDLPAAVKAGIASRLDPAFIEFVFAGSSEFADEDVKPENKNGLLIDAAQLDGGEGKLYVAPIGVGSSGEGFSNDDDTKSQTVYITLCDRALDVSANTTNWQPVVKSATAELAWDESLILETAPDDGKDNISVAGREWKAIVTKAHKKPVSLQFADSDETGEGGESSTEAPPAISAGSVRVIETRRPDQEVVVQFAKLPAPAAGSDAPAGATDATGFVTDLDADGTKKVQDYLDKLLAGDLTVAAFFDASKPKEREVRRKDLAEKFHRAQERVTDLDLDEELQGVVRVLKFGPKGIAPFHWQIEFPEVFRVDQSGIAIGGFDCIVGNPPFLGGTRISTVHGMIYFQWLTNYYPPAGHLCDLVAYFFRRCFFLLRAPGTMGLIATNTLAQGDTRNGGLTVICKTGGEIYKASRRYRWPGQVSVVVSVVHIAKGLFVTNKSIDDRPVDQITAYLFHRGGHDDPARLPGRNDLFSAGSKIYGQGFLFADDDDEATPLSEMHGILDSHEGSRSRVLPYMGGSELNSSPTLTPHRYVIYFSDIESEIGLAPWPELAKIVKNKVKPGRDLLGDNPNNIPLKKRWWAYQAHRPNLYSAMKRMDRVLLCSQVTPHLAFAFKKPDVIFSQRLNIFLIDAFAPFSVLQSRLHEVWARFCSSTSLELLSYTPSDSFETFPMPTGVLDAGVESSTSHLQDDSDRIDDLGRIGRKYHDFRAALMVRNDEGLTQTYNRFHNKLETNSEIAMLRKLHEEIDRAALDAYGWTDIHPRLAFILDYEDNGGNEIAMADSKRPWRYRWVDEDRDEVLARLLELNRTRAEEEAQSGVVGHATKTAGKRGRKPTNSAPDARLSLFEVQEPT